MYNLGDDIKNVAGIGPATAKKLERLDIHTVFDLLRHIPRAYYDFQNTSLIANLKIGKPQVIQARLGSPLITKTKKGKLLTIVRAIDQSGKIELIWFNNPFIKKIINPDELYTVAGKPTLWGNGKAVIAPIIESGIQTLHTKGYVPIYPQTAGLTSKFLRQKIYQVLQNTHFDDFISSTDLVKLHLSPIGKAYSEIHFPPSNIAKKEADQRLSFNEHVKIHLQNSDKGQLLSPSIAINSSSKINQEQKKFLPFVLTPDQLKAIDAIEKDISRQHFTHRLIQGDTGSGKTAVIMFSAAQILSAGHDVLLMAPTDILAHQHYKTFKKYFVFKNQIALITAKEKNIPQGQNNLIYIGTHSLLSEKNLRQFKSALVIIDEQHKFGVKQRDIFSSLSPSPHLINLSATPIPRTVALGLLGDINITSIKNMPLNRLPTKTHILTESDFARSPAWLQQKLNANQKILVVCPAIHQNNAIASVEKISLYYKQTFPNNPVFTIHGEQKTNKQQETINDFINAKGSILVSTSIIEVGVDIKDANIIIIHSAEMFGLASLHQLRGRVGRSGGQGYCFLVPTSDDSENIDRLLLLKKYSSGLTLAQKDFRLRGAGDVLGVKQHGLMETRLSYFWNKASFQKAKTFVVKNSICNQASILLK